MEKAVLKTLAYYDIFDFPLKAWEVHKWLIGKTASLKQVEKALIKLYQGSSIKGQAGYYFLTGKKGLVKNRLKREKISKQHLKTAKYVAMLFKIIPWIKLVGVSGSLAMMGSRKRDDIDLFIITGKNRIWITRIILIILTSILRLRRKRREKLLQAAGKICINLILEEDNLAQKKRNIYVAHEVLQMQVLWQRDNVYSNFLHANDWAFKFLKNWKSGTLSQGKGLSIKGKGRKNDLVDFLENLAKRLQLKIMNSPSGSERIETGALYFHPEDKGEKIMEEYRKRINQ